MALVWVKLVSVALVEGLVHRFPEDPEVRQWHAITYYRWGQDLLSHGNLAKAGPGSKPQYAVVVCQRHGCQLSRRGTFAAPILPSLDKNGAAN